MSAAIATNGGAARIGIAHGRGCSIGMTVETTVEMIAETIAGMIATAAEEPNLSQCSTPAGFPVGVFFGLSAPQKDSDGPHRKPFNSIGPCFGVGLAPY